MEANCPLCHAKKMSRWYHEDERLWIADCVICEVPMVVLKEHSMGSEDDLDHMVRTAKDLFGDDCWIDDIMRLIPDHRHFHVRYWTRMP
ncbi:MAG: hypothetical protein Q7O66_22470 [Dehalococcoidia bacterium]|nr:hypothetical protein [Dehalococcoidia bacterium]